jgi:hypothetical protein
MQQANLKKSQSVWCGRNARILAAVAILAFSSLFSANARAACTVSPGPQLDLVLPPQLLEHAPAQQSSEVPSDSSAHNSRPSITGLWFVTFYSADGVAFDHGFDVWHSDGTEILNDNGPPEPAWSTGSFCMGVWKFIGHNTYKLRHLGWNFDGDGNLSATVLILQTVTVDADGDSYRGPSVFDLYDPVSGKLMSHTTGEVKAHRIRVD